MPRYNPKNDMADDYAGVDPRTMMEHLDNCDDHDKKKQTTVISRTKTMTRATATKMTTTTRTTATMLSII